MTEKTVWACDGPLCKAVAPANTPGWERGFNDKYHICPACHKKHISFQGLKCQVGAAYNQDGSVQEGWPIQCTELAVGICACGKLACEKHINKCVGHLEGEK